MSHLGVVEKLKSVQHRPDMKKKKKKCSYMSHLGVVEKLKVCDADAPALEDLRPVLARCQH